VHGMYVAQVTGCFQGRPCRVRHPAGTESGRVRLGAGDQVPGSPGACGLISSRSTL